VGAAAGYEAETGRGRRWTRRAPVFVVSLAAAAAASSSPAAAAKLRCAHASQVPAHVTTTAARHALQCLVNDVRRRHRLRPLRAEAHLRRAAAGHAIDMAARDYFDHQAPDGSTLKTRVGRTGYLRGAGRWRLGEALVWGRGREGTPAAMLRRLMASPPHRAILLDPAYRELGIGLARGAPQGPGRGALTVTLDLGRRGR
jgi:uncharacterized protein YkwD